MVVDAIPCASFDDVFAALIGRKVEYAAVPIENTLGGSIHANYDLLLRHHGAVHIVGEHSFRVRHALLAPKGTNKADIQRVMSHPQALAQCDGFIRRNGWERVPAYDTAGSAKMIAEEALRSTAAICSASAAELFGLDILESGIEDDANNFTRFLLLSRSPALPPKEVPCKTTVVFQPSTNEAGILFKALSVFALREIDLCKIESRPGRRVVDGGGAGANGAAADGSVGQADGARAAKRAKAVACRGGESSGSSAAASFEYTFYVDLLAHTSDGKVQNALRHLGEIAPFARVLGCFPAEGILVAVTDEARDAAREQRVSAAAPKRSGALRVGVIGFGNFGQFLARWFVAAGHALFAASRTDYSDAAARIGVTFFSDVSTMLSESALDVLVLAPSIISFEHVLSALPTQLLEGLLVVDVLSVKLLPKAAMLKALPASCDIVCSHPMFGPESGKHGWRDLPFVYDAVRVRDRHRFCRFLALWEEQGCKMTNLSCEEHDRLAAGSQFVTHLTGRVLGKLALRSTPINTRGFESLLALIDSTSADSFDLFYALYAHNPNSTEQLTMYAQALESLRAELLAFKGDVPAAVTR